MSFYSRLTQLCERENIKLTPLLQKLELSTGVTGNWKRGTMPNVDTLIKLSNYFKVSTDYLLDLSDKENVMQEYLSEDDNTILEAYHKLDLDDRAEIRVEIKHMLRKEKYNKKKEELSIIKVAASGGEDIVKRYTSKEYERVLKIAERLKNGDLEEQDLLLADSHGTEYKLVKIEEEKEEE